MEEGQGRERKLSGGIRGEGKAGDGTGLGESERTIVNEEAAKDQKLKLVQ